MDPLALLGVALRVVVPIFVAMDAIGAPPLDFTLTSNLAEPEHGSAKPDGAINRETGRVQASIQAARLP